MSGKDEKQNRSVSCSWAFAMVLLLLLITNFAGILHFSSKNELGYWVSWGGHFHIGGLLTNLIFRCEVDVHEELLTLSRHMTVWWGACRFGRTFNGAKYWREPKSHIKALLVGLDWINVRLVHKLGLTRGFIVIKRRSVSDCFQHEISAERTVIPTPSRGRFSHQGGSWSWLFR